MLIQDVSSSDKSQILDFCKDTFSWGDYIELVWDSWMSEKNFLCIRDDSSPLGICHASISEPAKQVWIEGIRVHPEFRRRHLASDLVSKCEQMGLENGCADSFMLVESSNLNSLNLAKKLGYRTESTWVLYSIRNNPSPPAGNVRVLSEADGLPDGISKLRFVNSWRWYPFDDNFVPALIEDGRVISSPGPSGASMGTIIPSEHFDSTCMITILQAGQSGIDEIVRFAQNYGLQNDVSRLQLLADQGIGFSNNDVEKRLVFHLLKKRLG